MTNYVKILLVLIYGTSPDSNSQNSWSYIYFLHALKVFGNRLEISNNVPVIQLVLQLWGFQSRSFLVSLFRSTFASITENGIWKRLTNYQNSLAVANELRMYGVDLNWNLDMSFFSAVCNTQARGLASITDTSDPTETQINLSKLRSPFILLLLMLLLSCFVVLVECVVRICHTFNIYIISNINAPRLQSRNF